MKRFLTALCSLLFPVIAFASVEVIVLDNFDSKTVQVNTLKKETGSWSSEPVESGKGCKMSFGRDSKEKPEGASLRIKYNVRGDNRERMPMCGYWTRVGLNLSNFKFLSIKVRGDADEGFPKSLIFELKDKDYKTGKFVIEGITGQWQEFKIPLGAFREVQDWSNVIELGILFHESIQRTEGTVYLDDITFVGSGAVEYASSGLASVKAAGGITADGDAQDWDLKKMPSMSLDPKTDLKYGELKSRNDLSAQVYSQWDDEKLYFFIDVRDDEMVVVEDPAKTQEGDGVTLYFDGAGNGFSWSAEDDLAVALLPNGLKWIMNEDRAAADEEVLFGTKINPGRYTIEAAIPWSFLGTAPDLKKELAVSVSVQDLDITPKVKKSRISWTYTPKPGFVQLGKMPFKKEAQGRR